MTRRLALLAFLVHLVGNPHYGFFRDELYFIICGRHLDFGYVDQPPLAPSLAALTQIFGPSLVLLRAVAALFAAGSVYVTCLLVEQLEGGRYAKLLAATAVFFAPVLMNFGMKCSPDMIGLVLWPFAALWLLRAVRGEVRGWVIAGLTLGLAFQAKYSVVFYALALLAGLLLTPERRKLWSKTALMGGVLGALIALPNVIWQARAGFPMLELLHNGQTGKNLILSPAAFAVTQVLITNPLLALIWITGFFWLARRAETRFLAIAYLFLMFQMVELHGKHYYAANVYPVLFAAGAVAIESWVRSQVGRAAIFATTVLAGLVLVPYMMPILPVPVFQSYNAVVGPILHIDATKTENHGDGPLIQDYADMHGWPELAATVAGVYQSLSPEEKAGAVIAASNYGEAAAIEFLGEGLPPVISGHNQYFLWGPSGRTGAVLIDVNGDCGKALGLYESATVAAVFKQPYVMPYENDLPIMLCRGLKRPLADIWPTTKHYR